MAEDGEFLAVGVAETLTKLQFLSVAEVASVAEAGHDVAVAVDDRVAGGGPYFAVVAKIFLYGLHALTAADDGRKKDFVWLAVAEQAVDGGNDACACCEHRVHEQESLAIDVGARHVFGFYLKTAVVLVTAIGGEEGVFGIVKKVCYLFAVCAGIGVDWLINVGFGMVGVSLGIHMLFCVLVTIWLIINELISILENLTEIGVPIPKFLTNIVKRLKNTAEGAGEETEEEK